MERDDILAFLRLQKLAFKTEMGISKIGLFGSLARNEKPNDIDIMVEFEPGTQDLFEKKFKIKQIIEARFNFPTDICREKFIKPNVKDIIMRDVIFV
ncbi:MAG: nucleotidyltransferase domain-containing protein [Cytophagales bacterium]|nr:nucleotidyltransferase domain-containing protein [Cytophagales bacterium]MCA6366731.1 nucleotidyltransferase domain-containing protein [Cytophagales bacterium]MCA6372744.1 nucleotidyltransferase domain-containing protein [Cytophagales bacterium]MCA6377600.1 nucleotidyltransferase domain-containing protein [Cytophagales bacterium]MCA6384767.1 nucleotidyltransferase domain-containing protein [Cytophagales bacterium]